MCTSWDLRISYPISGYRSPSLIYHLPCKDVEVFTLGRVSGLQKWLFPQEVHWYLIRIMKSELHIPSVSLRLRQLKHQNKGNVFELLYRGENCIKQFKSVPFLQHPLFTLQKSGRCSRFTVTRVTARLLQVYRRTSVIWQECIRSRNWIFTSCRPVF